MQMTEQQLDAFDGVSLALKRINEVARLLGEEGARAGQNAQADRLMFLSDSLFDQVKRARAAAVLIAEAPAG